MSFEKFESLVNKGKLYFSRFDSFVDKLEGGVGSQNYPDISASYGLMDLACNFKASDPESPEKKQAEERILEINNETFQGIFGEQRKIDGDSYLKQVSSWLYASCWTDLPHECEAMWSLYGVTGIGCNHAQCCPECESTHGMSICIETTVRSILDNLEHDNQYNLSIQKVEYIDHKKTKFEMHELDSKPFFSKAKHFSYENEVRLMLWPDKNICFSDVCGGDTEKKTEPDKKIELKIKDLGLFIGRVILSPIPSRSGAEIRKSHNEKHQSNLGLQDSLSNKALKAKVMSLCVSNSIIVEVVDSDLNQVATNDLYSSMGNETY